ncbi:hypothetical protein E2C01_030254 [Portunus trituberculatus]|uniref:Uncharacterized protein n=1 Tax=Portunus trituberculatus TaxID=210409 RepID=A0A5B7ETR9_PORTR|nr:hypothetical protein [Portunus trituberculatus]
MQHRTLDAATPHRDELLHVSCCSVGSTPRSVTFRRIQNLLQLPGLTHLPVSAASSSHHLRYADESASVPYRELRNHDDVSAAAQRGVALQGSARADVPTEVTPTASSSISSFRVFPPHAPRPELLGCLPSSQQGVQDLRASLHSTRQRD